MKLLLDLLPLLIFFAAFKLYGIYAATIAAIAATAGQIGWLWWRQRRFETMHLMTFAILAVFGGLTIALQDEVFIKWKPSIVYWSFSAIIFGLLLVGKKSAMEFVMGRQITLPAAVWRKLNIAWGLFFLLSGGLNIYVAFYYNAAAEASVRTDFWVNFKVFGFTGLTFAFLLAHLPFLAKHIQVGRQ